MAKKKKLNAPKRVTWWISLVLGALGVLATFISIPFVSAYAFWFVAAGLVLLLLATALKDL